MDKLSSYYCITNKNELSDLNINNQEINRIKRDSSQELNPKNIKNLIDKYNDIYYYISLELLPIGKKIILTGLYLCSFDDEINQVKKIYRYSLLNEIMPEYFDNEFYKIMNDEYVSPIVILTDTRAYRVNPVLWVGLKEIYIYNKEKKIFPIDILITSHKVNNCIECEWIYNLLRICDK